MTSSSRKQCALALALLLCATFTPSWAALGEAPGPVAADSTRIQARRSVARMQRYTVHDLQMPDGSRVRQFVAANGLVFGVSWNTLYKPDLSTLLGTSFPRYADAAQVAARRGGIQRQFRHESLDLVVQSASHLHVFEGYAYRPSLMPQGVSAQSLGWG